MGEENTFAGLGTSCFFCKKEDIGTDREKWHEAKLNSFKVRDAMEVPEVDTEKMKRLSISGGVYKLPEQHTELQKDNVQQERKGWTNTVTFSLEPSEETKMKFIRWHHKEVKRQKGSRHYLRKLLKHVSKKTLRHYLYELRKRCIISYLP